VVEGIRPSQIPIVGWLFCVRWWRVLEYSTYLNTWNGKMTLMCQMMESTKLFEYPGIEDGVSLGIWKQTNIWPRQTPKSLYIKEFKGIWVFSLAEYLRVCYYYRCFNILKVLLYEGCIGIFDLAEYLFGI